MYPTLSNTSYSLSKSTIWKYTHSSNKDTCHLYSYFCLTESQEMSKKRTKYQSVENFMFAGIFILHIQQQYSTVNFE